MRVLHGVLILFLFFEVYNTLPIDNLYIKIVNNFSRFFSKPQIKRIAHLIGKHCIEQRSIHYTLPELQTFGLFTVANSTQRDGMLGVLDVMNREIGPLPADAVIYTMFLQLANEWIPYEEEMFLKCKTMTENKAKKGKIIGQVIRKLTQVIKPETVKMALENLKLLLDQPQCDLLFRMLAPKYFKLGRFDFKLTPCTGPGVKYKSLPPPVY